MMAFWSAYDAKGRERSTRDQVLAEWKRLHPSQETVAEIMASVAAWNASKSWQDGFALGAHRFLKTGKWRERPTTASSPTNANGVDREAYFAARLEAARRSL